MSTHYASEWRTARKSHVCTLCWRRIRPGERYLHGSGMDGGTAWSWKECAHCDTIRDLARLDWGEDEYGDDLIVEWEPSVLAHLRLKAMWRRKWARDDGSLYAVPEKTVCEDAHGFGWQVSAVAR